MFPYIFSGKLQPRENTKGITATWEAECLSVTNQNQLPALLWPLKEKEQAKYRYPS